LKADDQEVKEKEEAKNGADRLPRSQRILDDAEAVLAVGKGRRHHQDRR
jgi:hypothetical protein